MKRWLKYRSNLEVEEQGEQGDRNEEKRAVSPFLKLHTIALPLLLNNLLCAGIGYIDSAFMGRYSTPAYAGVGIISVWLYSLEGVLGTMATVFNIRGAKINARGEKRAFQDEYTYFSFLAVVLGVACAILLAIFSPDILSKFFGLDVDTILEAKSYVEIAAFMVPFQLLIFICTGVLKIRGNTIPILYSSITTLVLNTFLDYVLVFGKFGAPALGPRGAAWASVFVICIHFLFYYFLIKKRYGLTFSLSHKYGFKLDVIRSTLKEIIPFWLQEFWEDVFLVMSLNALVTRCGTMEFAAYILLSKIAKFLLMPLYAYSNAHTVVVAEELGKANKEGTKGVFLYTLKFLGCIFLLLTLVFAFFRDELIMLVTRDPKLILLSQSFLLLALLSQAPFYTFILLKSLLQAAGDIRYLLKLVVICNALVIFTIWYLERGIELVFISLGIGYLILSLILFFRMKYILRDLKA